MITVSLPPDVEQFVLQAVAEGKYPNEQDVVTDAIRLLRDLRKRHQRLRGEIDQALASVDRGEGIDIDSDESLTAFFDDLEREVRTAIAAEKQGAG
jgi:putative addiction module CopG family antidote